MEYVFSDKIAGVKPSAIREILKLSSDPSVIGLSAGNPAPEAFPVETIKAIINEIFQENPIAALQYSVSEGYPALRESVAAMCRERYHVGRDSDDTIIVTGAQQGMDLVCKMLCNEGDAVICEDPSFIGSLNAFRATGGRMVGVPCDEEGMDLEKLEKALKETPNVRFLYLIPNFQNPTGRTMSLQRRKDVLELARKYNTLILEDNPYGDLRFAGEDVPAIKSMDTEGRVIYVGTFSKILSPGLRVGYVILDKGLSGKLIVEKQCVDVHTPILNQMIAHKFITEHDLNAHLDGLRAIYRKKYGIMADAIRENFSPRVVTSKPQGGLFIWCTLPDGVDMLSFCTRAVTEYRVAVVPGTAFNAVETDPSQSFRINFSTPTDENEVKGIQYLGRLMKDTL